MKILKNVAASVLAACISLGGATFGFGADLNQTETKAEAQNGASSAARPAVLISDFENLKIQVVDEKAQVEGAAKAENNDGLVGKPWTATGDAFAGGAVSVDVQGGMGRVFGAQGAKLLNSFARSKDDSTGTLLSPPFVIERKNLVFSIGGGAFPGETGVALIVDGETVATETGLFNVSRQGDEGLRRRVWNVEKYEGKSAQFLVFDKKAGGDWGHIKVDAVYLTDKVDEPVANALTISETEKPFAYNPMIFGHFIEHFHRQVYGGVFEPGSPLADENGFRKDVVAAMKEVRVPIVRWPGGCFVSAYHWLDGVGPDREPTYDKAWHVEDSNAFGTAEFVRWCREIGAEPFICTNAGTGTPEEMSDWVEYCNLNIGRYGRMRQKHGYAEPFGVKYWSVGNENWGRHEMGAKTVGEWGPFVRESGKLMLNTDANIKLFAAALPDEGWTLPLLKEAGYLLDYVSIHGYWDFLAHVDNPAPYLDCMLRTERPEADIRRTIDVLERVGMRGRVKIAFDEWNLRGWHHPGHGSPKMDVAARDKNDKNSTYTMADALFSACFLNSCLRYGRDVEIACFSPMINTRGGLYVHKDGIVRRSTFYVFKMYTNELEKNVVPTRIDAERLAHKNQTTPLWDAALTCDDAQKNFALAVVNKDPKESVAISVEGLPASAVEAGKIDATVLSGSSPDDYNDVGRENNVVPRKTTLKIEDGRVQIPACSLSIIRWTTE